MKNVSNRDSTTPAEARDLFGGQGLFRRWQHYGENDGMAPFTVIVETEMEPGSRAGIHTQPGQHELLYILSGAGRFRIDGHSFDVKQGDALFARAGANFALENNGSGWLRYLAVKCAVDRTGE